MIGRLFESRAESNDGFDEDKIAACEGGYG